MLPSCHLVKISPRTEPQVQPAAPLTGMSFFSSVNYHHGRDDGDEGVAEGQQSLGGLRAAVVLSVGRGGALRERGGGGGLAHRGRLLHLLLDVVLYDVAVVVSPHCGGAKGPQREPCTQPKQSNNCRLNGGEGGGAATVGK